MSGAAPQPAPKRPRALGMNEREARTALELPVFGDERCIEAREILVLAELVRRRRQTFHDSFGAVHLMTKQELAGELAWWDSWNSEEDDEP